MLFVSGRHSVDEQGAISKHEEMRPALSPSAMSIRHLQRKNVCVCMHFSLCTLGILLSHNQQPTAHWFRTGWRFSHFTMASLRKSEWRVAIGLFRCIDLS